ncbi:MAG: ABC transporter ATP-binding protein [Desulfomonilaceae bacterium]
MSFLRIENLSKSFGRWRTVNDVNLEIRQGEIVSVIGPNGAGKTTLFNLISGRLKPDSGKVFFQGENVTGLPPHKIAKKSISRSFQISNIFANLTVYQNIRVPILAMRSKSPIFFRPLSSFGAENREALEVVEKLELKEQKDIVADLLSYGDRRKLEFGMAIAMKPKLLLLDEPTAGMNQIETEKTVSLLRKMATEFGLTLILTEHDMNVVFALADRILVMHQGSMLCEGPPEKIREDATVRSIYLGEEDWLY